MRRTLAFLTAVFILCPCFAEEQLSATDIIRRSDDLLRGVESYAEVTMVVTRPRWTRTVTMAGWTQGTENTLIRILEPAKDRGVGFLKKGREGWQYVPSIDRVMKIPPSMMLQSWLGSDFTNDDIVRADSLVVDYDHEIVSEPTENGTAYWIIEAVPRPGAPVVWGKVVFDIRKKNFVADRFEYYDEDGKLVKYCETSDIREIEGKELATKLVMYDVTRPGYSTAISYERMTFKPEITADTFTLNNLRRQ